MRIGGLATGMNVDEIVEKLMSAERMPLDRMEQDRTTLEWKRDGFRDINKTLLELDNMMLDMKLSKTYQSKTVTSSMEGAVTATATSGAADGVYKIKVDKLATAAMNVSTKKVDKIDKKLDAEIIKFKTYDKDGDPKEHDITIEDNDTIKDVLKKITDQDNNVRAFYDEQSGKVIMETTRTGKYSPKDMVKDESGNIIKRPYEIDFGESSFFTKVLNMNQANESGGTDAEFTYNDNKDFKFTSKNNSYTLNNVTFNFNATTNGESVTLNVRNDTEATFDKIIAFVDKYNEVVDAMNDSQREEKYRDFKPLTEAQKKEMTDKEIELWEEKAKSGLLRGETVISNGLFSMRNSWYSKVETGGDLTSLTQIGIKTSPAYMDGGKLIVDEDKLRTVLNEDPEGVQKLFSNSEEDDSRGLINRLEDSLTTTMNSIKARAGNSTSTLENYTLGKRMKNLNNRISAYEDRLIQVENRYWSQFTAMEKAIQRMNQQSSYMMSQFGQQ